MKELIHMLLFDTSYVMMYGLTFLYFLVLYFALAPLFLFVCRFLMRKKITQKIVDTEIPVRQIRVEMMHSFKSVVVFGFSVLPIIYLIRLDQIVLLPDTFLNGMIGVLILTLWNEVHFFIVHRIMHFPWMMKHIHLIHHKSRVPSVYAVYSFHWVEALLLSSVPLTIVPFIPFSPMAIFLYPLASILLNYAGHCNYRFGKGVGGQSWLFGTHHNQHHFKGKKNYGFALNFLDKLNEMIIQKNKK